LNKIYDILIRKINNCDIKVIDLESFDPALLFNSSVSFEEENVYVLDELTQLRATEENMRRCFSMRIASRIVSLVIMKGDVSSDNNFINAMDRLTKRFSTLFNSAYDFMNIQSATDDHLYVVQMMNNAIIDLMMNEVKLEVVGVSKPVASLEERDLSDLLRSILISQKLDFISFHPSGEVGFQHESPLLSSDQVRRSSLLNAVVKFNALGNIFDYFQVDFNDIIRYLLNEVMTSTEKAVEVGR
jgi:hypothetical protein